MRRKLVKCFGPELANENVRCEQNLEREEGMRQVGLWEGCSDRVREGA